jgi:hypothetical protein
MTKEERKIATNCVVKLLMEIQNEIWDKRKKTRSDKEYWNYTDDINTIDHVLSLVISRSK